MDLFSYLLGKKSGGGGTTRNWSLIGYNGEPSFIEEGFNHAKKVIDDYVETTDWEAIFQNDTDMVFAPLIDTSDVTSMWSVFNNCYNLIYVPAYNTSKATTMRAMFQNCSSLSYIDFTNFDTSNVTTMKYMFRRATALSKITLPFNTSKVEDMSQMFEDDFNLSEIDLSSFTSEAITTCANMFYNCRMLSKIDMRKFDFTRLSSVASYAGMFGTSSSNGAPNNCLIIVKDATQKSWFTSNFSRFTNVRTPDEL